MKINPSYKVIVDHLRSSAFLIADGVTPSNEGRGYVLRRIMRRAMRHIHKLGSNKAVMYKLTPSLIKEMGEAFPELVRAEATISDTLKIEEERFRKTLSLGMEILEEELIKISGKKLSGAVAFKLYDTYGFPLDLTQDILREKNLEVNLDEFEAQMEKQKQRSSENWVGSGEKKDGEIYFKLKEKIKATEFLGYKASKSKAKILAILKGGKEISEVKKGDENVEIFLDQTAFYATSGGQRGDDGNLILASEIKKDELIDYFALTNVIDILETKKVAVNLFSHFVVEIRGSFKVGDEVLGLINQRNRQFRAQNHSATHLLHFALKEILGNQITQKGSNVESKYFSFDFNHNEALTQSQIDQVEDLVNFFIRENHQVQTKIMSLEDARSEGAAALFGEKYDDEVRVLKMGKSLELCGGTHAHSTGNIGVFKIISERGIAAGIRRIEGLTGFFALEYSRLQERKLEALLESLKIKQQFDEVKIPQDQFNSPKKGFDDSFFFKDEDVENLVISGAERISMNEAILKTFEIGAEKTNQIKISQKEIDRLKKEKLSQNNDFTIEKIGEINFIHHLFENVNAGDLRDLATQTKQKNSKNTVILFFGEFEGKISAILGVSSDLTDKFNAGKIIPEVSQKIGGKGGGGKPDFAMCGGSNKAGISEAVELLRNLISCSSDIFLKPIK